MSSVMMALAEYILTWNDTCNSISNPDVNLLTSKLALSAVSKSSLLECSLWSVSLIVTSSCSGRFQHCVDNYTVSLSGDMTSYGMSYLT